jgi:hypothetical protein
MECLEKGQEGITPPVNAPKHAQLTGLKGLGVRYKMQPAEGCERGSCQLQGAQRAMVGQEQVDAKENNQNSGCPVRASWGGAQTWAKSRSGDAGLQMNWEAPLDTRQSPVLPSLRQVGQPHLVTSHLTSQPFLLLRLGSSC